MLQETGCLLEERKNMTGFDKAQLDTFVNGFEEMLTRTTPQHVISTSMEQNTPKADSDAQSTPQWLFGALDGVYHFHLDVCADGSNHKCVDWYGPGGVSEDALSIHWPRGEWLWMNPPYSRGNQRKFVEKAIAEAWKGSRTLALLPADTSTKLFHELVWKRYHVDFLPKRLKFNGADNSAKFGSMLVKFELI